MESRPAILYSDDIFARPVYAMRDVLPETSLAIYHAWLGAVDKPQANQLYEPSVCRSIGAGLLALLMFYGLGNRLGGPEMALWCAALAAIQPVLFDPLLHREARNIAADQLHVRTVADAGAA